MKYIDKMLIASGVTLLLTGGVAAAALAPGTADAVMTQLPGEVAIFASKGGAPTNPDWYHNLRANPHASVEIGPETHDVIARVAEGEERDRIWTRQKERNPGFASYEQKTSRQIPVVILQRVPAEAKAVS